MPVLVWITMLSTGCGPTESISSKDGKPREAFLNGDSLPLTFHENLNEGLTIARKLDKPVLLLFTDPNCVYSRQMLESTFQNEEVQSLANRFVCVQVDSCNASPICEQFHVEAFPTIQFLSSNGIPLQRLKGNQMPEQLTEEMRLALQRIAMKQSAYSKYH
jgi:thioredoxin-related protein